MRQFIALMVCVMACAVSASAVTPVVTNVSMAQRTDGSGLVDITYDVADDDSPELAVAAQFSVDGGVTWNFPALNLTGDLGQGVTPGTGRHIIWNVGALPEPQDLGECRVRVIASDSGILHKPHSPANVAIIDWTNIDWADESSFEKYARADFCMVLSSSVWSDEFRDVPVIERIKSENPDTKVIGYVSSKSAQLWAESPAANAFWHEWFVRTSPYWVRTTTGDTAQDWPGNVLLNILNPDCRTAIVETIVDFQNSSVNKLDGIMWDYFNASLWIWSGIPNLSGDPDMDGNGIGHWADPAEMVAFRNAQVDLIGAVRDSLGEGFIQIFNGQRAYTDLTFASLADGVLYEIFPTIGFPQPNMKNALDPAYSYNLYNVRDALRTGNGGPWVLLSNPWLNQYVDMNGQPTPIVLGNVFRVVAMLMDGFSAWHVQGAAANNYSYAWTDNDICVGEPIGPPVYDGNFIRREFQYGRVELEWKTGRYPDPFKYKVWALGQIVEELRVPYHFP